MSNTYVPDGFVAVDQYAGKSHSANIQPAQGNPDWLPEGVERINLHSYDGARGAVQFDEMSSPAVGRDENPEPTFEERKAFNRKVDEDRIAWMDANNIPRGNVLEGHSSAPPFREDSEHVGLTNLESHESVVLDFPEDEVDENGDIVEDETPKPRRGRPPKNV